MRGLTRTLLILNLAKILTPERAGQAPLLQRSVNVYARKSTADKNESGNNIKLAAVFHIAIVSQIWNTIAMQPVIFHPKALEEFRGLPRPIRVAFGALLRTLQEGISLGMPVSRPMPIVALGVDELRVKDAFGQYRAFYLKKSSAGILVLRAFQKKSQSTPATEISLARKRLKELHDDLT